MNYFLSWVKPYIKMMVLDVIVVLVWLVSLQWVIWSFNSLLLRVLLEAGLIIVCCLDLAWHFRVLVKQYGTDGVTNGRSKKEFERIAKDLLRNEDSYVVVYTNINQFKLINDMYGNVVGDTILKEVHSIINDDLRWDEVSGRLMADNFGILMRFHSIKKLDERLLRISERVHELSDEKGDHYGITMTYGVYIVTDYDLSVESMLERANLAFGNVSKNAYLVPLGVYDESSREKLSREHELEMRMHRALDNKEFVPFLQPKYELKSESVAGAEALVRWISPEEGMIFPNEFIPLFEKNGFIVKLDLFMFEEVCKIIDRWESAGCRIIPISVNLSRANFSVPDFFEEYKRIVKKYNVPKSSIEFEFTESLLYNNMDALNQLVNEIHDLGFECSIDDFGSGYSSLNMLKDVQVDVLKLDRVFFSEGDNSQRGKDVIRSVIGLAQALRLKTVSEGIELQNQVDFLKEMNCDYVQGYIFAKPMTVSAFEHLVYLNDGLEIEASPIPITVSTE